MAGHPAWTALLLTHVCPTRSLVAPCQPGAAPRDSGKTSGFQGTAPEACRVCHLHFRCVRKRRSGRSASLKSSAGNRVEGR